MRPYAYRAPGSGYLKLIEADPGLASEARTNKKRSTTMNTNAGPARAAVSPGEAQRLMGKISNRTLIHLMKAWDWEELNTKSGWTEMRMGKVTVKVRSADYGARNTPPSINQIIGYTGTRQVEFFARLVNPEPVHADPKPKAPAVETAPEPVPAAPKDVTPATPSTAVQKPVEKTSRTKSPAPRQMTMHWVIEVMESLPAGTTMSTQKLHREARVLSKTPLLLGSVRNCLVRLEERELVTHHGSGVYSWIGNGRPKPSRFNDPGAIPDTPPVEELPPAPTPAPAPAPAPLPVTTTPETREALLNDLLDMMFPHGFKAGHITKVLEWRTVTSELMDMIGE